MNNRSNKDAAKDKKTELIEFYLKETHTSKTQFCRQCKICPSTLNKVLTNDFNFNFAALFKIARVLKINIAELLKNG